MSGCLAARRSFRSLKRGFKSRPLSLLIAFLLLRDRCPVFLLRRLDETPPLVLNSFEANPVP